MNLHNTRHHISTHINETHQNFLFLVQNTIYWVLLSKTESIKNQ